MPKEPEVTGQHPADGAAGADGTPTGVPGALAGPAILGALLAGLCLAARRQEALQNAPHPWWKPKLPTETHVQGAQSAGAMPPHEVTDVDAGLVAKWLVGITLAGMLMHAALWGVFHFWFKGQLKELVPPVSTGGQISPPAPRLLPAPARNSADALTQRTWDDAVGEQRARETGALTTLGLYDVQAGLPQLPPAAEDDVRRLEGASPAGSTPTQPISRLYTMPSYSSGGTGMEEQPPGPR